MTTKFATKYGDILDLIWNDTGRYNNDRIALRAVDIEGDHFLTASVNLVDEKMEEGEMAIKDYAENEGVLEHLISQGIVSEPVRHVANGHVMIPIVKYLGLK